MILSDETPPSVPYLVRGRSPIHTENPVGAPGVWHVPGPQLLETPLAHLEDVGDLAKEPVLLHVVFAVRQGDMEQPVDQVCPDLLLVRVPLYEAPDPAGVMLISGRRLAAQVVDARRVLLLLRRDLHDPTERHHLAHGDAPVRLRELRRKADERDREVHRGGRVDRSKPVFQICPDRLKTFEEAGPEAHPVTERSGGAVEPKRPARARVLRAQPAWVAGSHMTPPT